jgi:hypothetical protein
MNKKWWVIALVICLLIATAAPLASSSPDGLEKVAEDIGFANSAKESPFMVLTDYIFPGIENVMLATILASWLGTIILFIIVYGLMWAIKIMKDKTTNEF